MSGHWFCFFNGDTVYTQENKNREHKHFEEGMDRRAGLEEWGERADGRRAT